MPLKQLSLLFVIYLGFVSLGLPDGTLGVAWPAIAADLRVPIGLAGTITIVTTLLSAASGFTSGRVIARFHTGPVVLVSSLLTGSALLALAGSGGLSWLLAAAIPLGLGAGAVDAGLNGYVARHYSGRHMNWLHACWGLGATCGPLVMGEAMKSGHTWRGGYVVLGAAQLVLAAIFLVTLRLWSAVPERASATAEAGLEHAPSLGANSFPAWLSPALLALYVALETAAGLWAGSVLVVARGFTTADAAWCTAGYYGSIMTGRLLVGFVIDRWGNRVLIKRGLLLASLGTTVFVFAATPSLAAAGLILIGLGFAPVYPGLMHEVPRRFAPEAAQTVIGRQSGAAYLGMAVLPPALGSLAELSLNSIPVVVLGGIIILVAGVRHLDRLT